MSSTLLKKRTTLLVDALSSLLKDDRSIDEVGDTADTDNGKSTLESNTSKLITHGSGSSSSIIIGVAVVVIIIIAVLVYYFCCSTPKHKRKSKSSTRRSKKRSFFRSSSWAFWFSFVFWRAATKIVDKYGNNDNDNDGYTDYDGRGRAWSMSYQFACIRFEGTLSIVCIRRVPNLINGSVIFQ